MDQTKKPSKRNMYVFGGLLIFTFVAAGILSAISPSTQNNLWLLVLLQANVFIAAALEYDNQKLKYFSFKEIADLKNRIKELETKNER